MNRLMASDKNQDGKLSKDEVDGRLQAFVTRADVDNDGYATKSEIEKHAAASVDDFPGRGGPGDGDRDRGERGGFGGPRGFGFGPGGAPGFGGPPNPEQFVARAFEFDADKDGKLSKDELTKMLESGPPRDRGPRDEENRRPQRPERQ